MSAGIPLHRKGRKIYSAVTVAASGTGADSSGPARAPSGIPPFNCESPT